ncbi:hypothetical protein BC943DRAFT_340092 [Umbelopsis sp. AD052]|nr:hypothetical protein BC943DRAFT_340092 [Umbelopsis sp. AD052]
MHTARGSPSFADENPFAMLELIQFCVAATEITRIENFWLRTECLEEQVDRVRMIRKTVANRMGGYQSELDILFNLDKVHVIMDEIIMNGMLVEGNRKRAAPQMT